MNIFKKLIIKQNLMKGNLQIKHNVFFPKTLGVLLTLMYCFSVSYGQCPGNGVVCNGNYANVVISEVSGDAAQTDGSNDAIVELTGPAGTDIGCMVISNSEWAVVLPSGTTIPADGVFLIACSFDPSFMGGVGGSFMANGLEANGFGDFNVGFAAAEIDLDVCDPANSIYYFAAASGFTLDNSNAGDGDAVVLFQPDGTVHDAVTWGSVPGAVGGPDNCALQNGPYTLGDNDNNGVINDNASSIPGGRCDGNNATGVAVMPDGDCNASAVCYTMPQITDPVYTIIPSATYVGCNSSYIRLDNGTSQGGAQGSPSHMDGTYIDQPTDANGNPTGVGTMTMENFTVGGYSPSACGNNVSEWAYTDHPTPGLANDVPTFAFYIDNAVQCTPGDITITAEIYNWQQMSDNADIGSGDDNAQTGAYIFNPITGTQETWSTYNVSGSVTTMTYTFTIPTAGTYNFGAVIDDYSNCCGTSGTPHSQGTPNECYETFDFIVTAVDPLMATQLTIDCDAGDSPAGAIDAAQFVTGGDNLMYELFDISGGSPGTSIAGPQSTGAFLLNTSATAGDYEIVVTDGSACSPPVTLTVLDNCEEPPVCPEDFVVTIDGGAGPVASCPGDAVQLCFDGNQLPPGGNITWQVSTDGGGTFEDIQSFPIPAPQVATNAYISQFVYDPGGFAGSGGVPTGCSDGASWSNTNSPEVVEIVGTPNGDISGWTIGDAGASYTFPIGTILPADGVFVICASTCAETAGGFTCDFVVPSGTWVYGNSGDNIILTDGTNVVSQVSYGNQSCGATPNCIDASDLSNTGQVIDATGTSFSNNGSSYGGFGTAEGPGVSGGGGSGGYDSTPANMEFCATYTIPASACPAGSFDFQAVVDPFDSANCPVGAPDENDAISATVSATVSCPSATLTTALIDVCASNNAGGIDIPVTIMGGTGLNYTVEYAIDGVAQPTISIANGGVINIPAPTAGEIAVTLISVTDEGGSLCSGSVGTDEVLVNIRPEVDITITSSTQPTNCSPCDGSITFDLNPADATNTNNYDIDYTFNGALQSISGVSFPFTLENLCPGTYDIVAAADDFGCAATVTSNAQVLNQPSGTPLMVTAQPATVCNDGTFDVDLSTDATYSPAWTATDFEIFDVDPSTLPASALTNTPSPLVYSSTAAGTTTVISGVTANETYFVRYTDPTTGCQSVAPVNIVVDPSVCCTPPTFTAVATCSNNGAAAAEGEYFINVDVTDLGQGVSVDITDGTMTMTAQPTGMYVFGPYTNMGGTTTQMITVSDNADGTCNAMATVSEVICLDETGGASGVYCDCTAANTGEILAQVAPGSFDAATTTMVYVLTDSNGDILDSNNTGLFTALPNNDYQVHAFNVFTADLATFNADLAAVTSIIGFTSTACNAGCGASANYTVNCAIPVCAISSEMDICAGDTDGSFMITVTGGTSMFDVSISNDVDATILTFNQADFTANELTVMNLGAATYTIMITDANGCVTDCVATITENPLPVVTASAIKNVCLNDNANFVSMVSGGSGNYSYVWTDNNGNPIAGTGSTNTFSSATAVNGMFTLTVSDDDTGCTGSAMFQVVIEDCMCAATDIVCEGDDIIATTSGNNTATKDTWFLLVDPSTGNIVAVVDNDATATFPTGALTSMMYQVHVLNFDPNDPPSPLATNPTAPGGLVGTSLASIGSTAQGCFNADLCTDYLCYTLADNPVCQADPMYEGCENEDIVFSGFDTGDAGATYTWTTTASGGIPSGFDPTIANPTITGLTAASAGVYTVTILNSTGCMSDCTATVTLVAGPTVEVAVVKEACVGQDLEFVATVSGGSGNYSYAWTDVNGVAFGSGMASETYTTNDVSQTGTYTVVVTDLTSTCTTTATVNATVIDCMCTENIVCEGDDIIATTSGNNTATKDTWFLLVDPSTGNIVAVVDNDATATFPTGALTSTMYQVHVLNFDPNDPPSPLTVGSTTADLINVSLSTIGDGATGCFNADLCTDYLCYTLADNPVCQADPMYEGCENEDIVFSGFDTGDAGATYTWTTTASGGIPSGFDPTIANPTITGLTAASAGVYTVTILNSTGCMSDCTATVTLVAGPTVEVAVVKEACVGQDLEFVATVSGGSGNYSYAWTDVNGVAFGSGMASETYTTNDVSQTGTYTVVVTDLTSTCTTTATVNATVIDCMCTPITICSGNDIITSTSGNNTATKDTWFLLVDASGTIISVIDDNSSATFSTASLATGMYQVHVLNFDPNDPPSPLTVGSTTADLINVSLSTIGDGATGCFNADLCTDYICYTIVENPVCMATNDGPVCVGDNVTLGASLVSGPASIDTYSWTGPNAFTSTDAAPMITNVTSADAGAYTVTITDTNGCTTMCSTTVVINENPVVTAIVVKEACIGQDLQFTATVTGGSGNYTYAWTDVNGVAFGTGMATETYTTNAVSETGTYTVVVTDATTSCTSMATVSATVVDCMCTPVTICPGDDITVSAIDPAPAPKLQWYLLVDPATGEILDANDTGVFMTTALANGTYQVHALNFDPATPPSPLMTGDVPADLIGVFLGTIGSTTQGCFNADLCTEYLCYTIEDITDPIITMCPANVTIECDESTDPTLNVSLGGEPVATDNCTDTPDLVITFADVITPGACVDANTITRTWTVTDEAGNSTTCAQTITVEDTTSPMMDCTLVNDLIIECNSSDDYTTVINNWITASEMTFDNNATDNCDTDVMISNDWDGSLPTLSCDLSGGNITITFTATDNCGNIFTCDKDVFLDDSVDPMVTCPADVTFEACGTDVLLTATLNPFSTVSMPLTGSGSLLISDACDTDLTVTYIDDDNGTALCDATNLVVTRTFTVTDDCGNSSTCSQDFVIQDTTPPTITCPADMTMASCTQSTDPATTGNATATDNCTADADITITFSDTMSPVGCTGDAGIIRTFTATDACGNSNTCIQNIMVVDMDAPTITCPTDLTIECVDGTDYVAAINTWIATATATDVCDADVAITTDYDGTSTPTACDLVTGLPITFTATDDCGNTDICTASVFINDTQPPVITCPADMTMASCTQSTDPATTGNATATDACSAVADIVITFSDSTSPVGCTGNDGITRTFTATDACGNSSVCTQQIAIVDMDPPVITCPIDLTMECVDGADYVGMINTWISTATATDVCDSNVAITTDYDGTSIPASCDVVTGLPITFTATDDCGNTDICTANVFINDTVEPNAVCQNLTINYDLCATAPVIITADQINNGSNDACSADADLILAIDMDTFDCSNEGDNIVTLTVTDECGNTSTCQAIVTIVVEDIEPPLVTNDFHCSEKVYDGSLLTAKCQATNCTNGSTTTVTWWSEATGGIQLGTGDTFDPINDPNFDPTVAGCYTYYAQCEFANGCVSERGTATFQVIDCDVECTDGCLYFLVLEDSANNGWDGASIDVTVNEGVSTNYKLGALGCNNGYQVIPITVNDGGLIDLAYWNGANETEHAWTLFDWSMTTILSTGYDAMGCNTVAPDTAVNTTVRTKAECPECCVDEGNFIVRITMGDFPEEQSWEIYNGIASTTEQGTQVIGINATAYTGLAPGFQITYDIELEKCETYTFAAFDGFNDSWNGGSWEIITSDLSYGNEITNLNDPLYGNSLVLSGPADAAFTDEDRVQFTIPCQNCFDDVVNFSDPSSEDCLIDGILPANEPFVCYPDCNHALPAGCINDELVILVNGDPSNAVTIPIPVGFDYTTGINVTDLPVGCHKLVQATTYCDGVIAKCTTDLNIVRDINPSLACNDLVNVSLQAPDGPNSEDDLGECVIEITPDMVLEMPNACEGEYTVTVLDTNGEPLIVYSNDGLPLDNFGNPIPEGNQSIEIAHDFVSGAQAGQTLTYVVEHKFSENKCWGEILIEDKLAPVIVCTDYDLSCTHPEALNENYTHTEVYEPPMELPANIAGGTAGLVSNTFIPINMPCGALGEVIQNIEVAVDLSHNDVTDLAVFLHLPSALDAALGGISPLQLDANGDVGASNIYTPNPVNDAPSLLALLGAACTLTESIVPEDFITENSGNNVPANVGNTWYIQIVDNNATFPTPPFGGGEITAASITLTCGFPTPVAAFDCTLQSVELINEQLVETNCDQSDWNGAQIVRTWQAIDAFGNSSVCTQTVNLKAPAFSDLIFPEDQALECSDDVDSSVEATGVPAFGCFPIQETQHDVCDIVYTFEDQEFITCGNSKKIFRTWTVMNCCNLNTKLHTQLIKIEDTEGPVINVDDIVANTAVYDCNASIAFNEAITDGCSDVTSIIVSFFEGGGAYNGSGNLIVADVMNGETIDNLPLGVTELLIKAQDGCLNITEEIVSVTISDNTPPVAICDDNLNISLGSDGTARVMAEDIDEGSYDNCGEITLEVRRVDGCLGTTPWAESVPFECCDVNEMVTVELRVTDAGGNTNVCWQQVLVEDALAPSITCPDDVTVDCDDDVLHNIASLGDPIAIDNCNVTLDLVETDNRDNCQAGTITRRWTATDGSDKSNDASCTQTITVEHISDFVVQFPADVTVSTCPDSLGISGEPSITDDDCELLAINYDDLVLTIVDDACYRIERTWTIVNWCVYDEGNAANTDLGIPQPLPRTFRDDDGFFTYVQTITVQDSDAPIITCPGDQTFCDLTDGCEGEAQLTIEVEDGCSPAEVLEYTYKIDAFNDGNGVFDIVETGNDATGIYPYGTHLIKWIVEDGCGNTSSCSYLFTIEDCKNPTPVCLNGISLPNMETGCVDVWASDLLEYAFDNCSSDEFVENSVRIRRAGSVLIPQASITLCCDDLGIVPVEIWVEDEAGNADFCTTYIDVQDNLNNCDSQDDSRTIAGSVETREGEMVELVEVELTGGMNMEQTTPNAGNYMFDPVNTNMNYTITPKKDIDPLNGVSTFDIVLMNQHILGINELTNPYQMIAADVNNDGNITTFDVVQTRQLILYVINDFPSNTSWRFVPKDFVFVNPTNPWSPSFPEVIDIENLQENRMDADFIGIKIGDVNGDAVPNTLLGAEERNMKGEVNFKIDDAVTEPGTSYRVDFRASDFNNLTGYQFTLNYDQELLEFASIEAGAIAMKENNIGLVKLNEGIITTSWNVSEAIDVQDDQILFSMYFNVFEATQLSKVLNIDSRYTVAEAYNNAAELLNVNLEFVTEEEATIASNEFELYQNKPNPFTGRTTIGFNLPTATSATMSVHDVAGKLLRVIEGDFDKGYNEVMIDAKDLKGTGVLYYQLDTPDHSATKKMIILD